MFVNWKLESSTKAAFIFKIMRIRIQIKPPLEAGVVGNHEIQNDIAILEKPSAYFLLSTISRELISCLKGGALLFTARFQEHNCNLEMRTIYYCTL